MVRFWVMTVLLVTAISAAGFAGAEENAVETATFSMFCYWTGEATVGRVDGVLASRIGHWGGTEIVQVDFDPQRTSVAELVVALRKQQSFDGLVVAKSDAAPKLEFEVPVRSVAGEPNFVPAKYSLRYHHPDLMELDLSEAQAMALNSWSYFGGEMPAVLTAEQLRRLAGD